MHRRIRLISAVLILAFCFTACSLNDYGKQLGSLDELKQTMAISGIKLMYPENFTAVEGADYNFVLQEGAASEKTEGYKLYRFAAPFYVGVYAYRGTSDTMKSDNPDRLEKLEVIESAHGDIEIYAGKGYEDALYLIGMLNIGGNHYECRVTANKDMKDNVYVNAIYRDNDNYPQAVQEIKTVLESLEELA